MEIVVDDLTGPEIAEFLAEHIEEKAVSVTRERKHALDLDGCASPRSSSGRCSRTERSRDAVRSSCSATEIKSMRVAPTHRRRGLASALLRHIIAESRRMGISRLSLETGSFAFSEPARRLYLKHGFELCGPFGDYEADPNSACMTRTL